MSGERERFEADKAPRNYLLWLNAYANSRGREGELHALCSHGHTVIAGLGAEVDRLRHAFDVSEDAHKATAGALAEEEDRVDRLRAQLQAAQDDIEGELGRLERWAGEQNAGNAFAQQVRYWALSHIEALRTTQRMSDEP